MKLPQIITSLLEQDLYKFSMGQAIFHQFSDYKTTWDFKCRNEGVKFTPAMAEEIRAQVHAFCQLRFTEDELAYLDAIPWIKGSYVDFLRLWYPNENEFDVSVDENGVLSIETRGTWLNTTMYEIPTLAIVNEVYFRMEYDGSVPGKPTYEDLVASFREKLDAKCRKLDMGLWQAGTFSEFGLRRRLSAEAQDMAVAKFKHLERITHDVPSRFVGTSNVYLAKKHGVVPVGTMAHEWIMCVGQGNRKHNPAYSNWYALEAWVREYGVMNGTALTDTLGTDLFLRDFRTTYATLFSGVRHDSGDPFEWGEKILAHYRKLGIDARGKTLLFSDSLDFQKADRLYRHFQDHCKVAFGIGTYLSNDTCAEPLNIVMKVTRCNGQAVAKLSDTPGKGMCRDAAYVEHLGRAIRWRMEHGD